MKSLKWVLLAVLGLLVAVFVWRAIDPAGMARAYTTPGQAVAVSYLGVNDTNPVLGLAVMDYILNSGVSP